MQYYRSLICLIFLSLASCIFPVEGSLNRIKDNLKEWNSSEVAFSKSYHFQVAIAAIFQNETPYLKEWIEYHKLIGVEHFYLYNNLSQDDHFELLAPYIARGEVELIEWPYKTANLNIWNRIQCRAYMHAIKLACGHVKWLALIDTDEFLVPMQNENLQDFLNHYEGFGGVCANWQLFGTSLIEKIPSDKLMIETLLIKAEPDNGANIHVKSIVRPETVLSINNPHHVKYKTGFFQVTTKKEKFDGPFSPNIAIDKLRINHYWSRDEHFFYEQKMKRYHISDQAKENLQEQLDAFNCVADYEILRFVPLLRKAMEME
jgi:hypothetical protein